MLHLLRIPLRWFGRTVLSLRYTVTIRGAEKLKGLTGPTLVMPNHPGYVDPMLVLTNIGKYIQLQPLIFEGTYRNPVVYPLARILGAIEVPDLQQASQEARDQTTAVLDNVEKGLKRGECFLIYPSGRLQRAGKEVVGAARAASDILTRRPDTKVVLLRTQGLWGSSFGFAPTGRFPSLNDGVLNGLKAGLANLLFFMPRRKVTMDIEVFDTKDLPGLDRDVLNPFLEKWYNEGVSDEPIYVPYHFSLGPRTFAFPKLAKSFVVPLEKIKPETKAQVAQILQEKLKRPLTEAENAPDFPLEKYGFDSLERMEVALAVEQRFGFRSTHIASVLGELWALAQGLIPSDDSQPIVAPPLWQKRLAEASSAPISLSGKNLLESVCLQAVKQWDKPIVADDVSGALTYEQFILRAQLLSEFISDGDDTYIGLLLPASVAADMMIISSFFARKTPVMINWTTGPSNLNHAITTLKIKRIVTSKRFMDRIGLTLEGVTFVYLEDLAKKISKVHALMKLLTLRLSKQSLIRNLPPINPSDTAVVLFTSGSEKAPKAVPLSHGNILSNLSEGLPDLGLKANDVILGFLPPFHSLGLTGNIFLSLLNGVPMVHHPDPTDAATLCRKIKAYRPTFMFSTPTFFSYILNRAEPGDLESMRLVITGAEKCPDALYDIVGKLAPNITLTEAYGITECSPAISFGRPKTHKRGTIGQPIDGIEVRVIDIDTKQIMPQGEMGILVVHGPNVFSGYLNYEGDSPFMQLEGKTWYVTGDLVRIDPAGNITFSGRLKRFIKAGGEMISLPALEEALAKVYPPTDKGSRVAVEGIETEGGGRKIVLFTTFELSIIEANGLLRAAGFQGIMRLDEVRVLKGLPLLGTGKTDYKVLRAQI